MTYPRFIDEFRVIPHRIKYSDDGIQFKIQICATHGKGYASWFGVITEENWEYPNRADLSHIEIVLQIKSSRRRVPFQPSSAVEYEFCFRSYSWSYGNKKMLSHRQCVTKTEDAISMQHQRALKTENFVLKAIFTVRSGLGRYLGTDE